LLCKFDNRPYIYTIQKPINNELDLMQYLLRKANTTGLALIKSKYDYLLDYLGDFVPCI